MYLFFSILIFLFVAQVLMGLFASKVKKGLKKKYSYYLGEQIEFNKILEKYQADQPNLSIIASDEIDDVCVAEDNLIIVNKKAIYAKDLYSNLYLLFQLRLTQPDLKQIRNIYTYQSIVFFSQFVAIVLFLLLNVIAEVILICGFILFLLNIFLLGYGIYQYSRILKQVMAYAVTELKLDSVEQARAETLIGEIKYEVLTYPLEIPWRITRFWS